jgi:mono/diheme cytochrome c family protein
MTVPLTIRIGALVLASTAFYTYVGQMVPQSEVHPPAEIALKADLTTADMEKIGREIMEGKGLCLTCHTIGKSGALRFPDLAGVGARAQSRIPGISDVDYLAESMYEPNAFIVPGFNPGMPTINKPPIGLTDQEILCVIAYLQTLGGTPTVTLQTSHRFLSGAPGAAPAPAAPKKGTLLRPAGSSPVAAATVSATGTLQPVAAHRAAVRLARGTHRPFVARLGGADGGVPR